MKFIKCLRGHYYSDYIGILIDSYNGTKYYKVSDILENKPHLFNYKVLNISARGEKK